MPGHGARRPADDIAPAQVKLFVWDLDDTVWHGTLADGPVELDRDLAGMIRGLNDRGVLNTICSKNDPLQASEALGKLGIEGEFVMARISRQPKGQMLQAIIADFQLRPANVVFVDDNPVNLEEAKFYNPGILTFHVTGAASVQIRPLVDAVLESNRPDGRKRLADYRLLEAKNRARSGCSDNVAFMRSIGLRVTIDGAGEACLDRIDELVNRTNQLNFTKNRMPRAALASLLMDGAHACHIVSARDKFGDYGIIGFAAMERRNARAVHFVFSCRILHMGIEDYVWRALGCPEVVTVGEVSAPLAVSAPADWIKAGPADASSAFVNAAANGERGTKTLMIGGCDLEQTAHFLKPGSGGEVMQYFNGISPVRAMPMHRDGIHYLFGARFYGEEERRVIHETVPFVESGFYDLPPFDDCQTIIYSPLIDYVQLNFVHRQRRNLIVSFGDFTQSARPQIEEALRRARISSRQAQDFMAEWEAMGPVEPADFRVRLDAVFQDYRGTLIVLGGAETIIPPRAEKYRDHHARCNKVLREFAGARTGRHFLAIDGLIHAPEEFADSIRHYRPVVHKRLADEITRLVAGLRARSSLDAARHRFLQKAQDRLGHFMR